MRVMIETAVEPAFDGGSFAWVAERSTSRSALV